MKSSANALKLAGMHEHVLTGAFIDVVEVVVVDPDDWLQNNIIG